MTNPFRELEVRAARASDAPALAELYNHYISNSPATFDLEPKSVEERREWMGHYASRGPHRLLVAVGQDEVLGYATSSVFRPKAAYSMSVEMTVYAAESATGQGVGSALYARLVEELESERVHRAFAGITLPNPASEALHRKFGFEPIGIFHEAGHKFDRFWSVQWFERAFG